MSSASLGTSTIITQSTTMTPQQIQVVKMLELPIVDLQPRINEELMNNPALEEGPDPLDQSESLDDILEKEEQRVEVVEAEDDYVTPSGSSRDDVSDFRQTNYSGGTSLFEYLKSQVYLTPMDKPQRHIAKWVLGNVDEDGFLRRTVEQLTDDLAFQEGIQITDDEMRTIVGYIKGFDPAGVGAYDLQECLVLQLKAMPQSSAVETALRIITVSFDQFAKRHFSQVCQKLEITDDEFREASEVIMHLNQRPANAVAIESSSQTRHQTIIPDFYVSSQDDVLTLSINTGDIPALHVSPEYHKLLADNAGNREASRAIKGYIDSASIFIDAIRQRNLTLKKTMEAILHLQRDFFLTGDDTSLHPMTLQKVAEITGLDRSTISRVSNSKYVQTEYGIFPLKHFFSDAMTNNDGEEISTREIKQILSELVAQEDKTNPLNDDAMVEELNKRGYNIARRTVAKYRDQLGIAVARMRREV